MMRHSSKLIRTVAVVMAVAGCTAGGDAFARYRCTAKQMASGTISCLDNPSSSADFSSSCIGSSPTVVEIEVECPRQERDDTSGDYYDGADKNA